MLALFLLRFAWPLFYLELPCSFSALLSSGLLFDFREKWIYFLKIEMKTRIQIRIFHLFMSAKSRERLKKLEKQPESGLKSPRGVLSSETDVARGESSVLATKSIHRFHNKF